MATIGGIFGNAEVLPGAAPGTLKYSVTDTVPGSDNTLISRNFLVDLPLSLDQATAIVNDPSNNLNTAEKIAILKISKDPSGQQAVINQANPAPTLPTAVTPASEEKLQGTVSVPTSDQVIGDSSTTAIQPYKNILHNYGSYTYSLSLSALSLKDFSDISANPGQQYIPNNVMFASAGRFTEKRDPHFTRDFFFEKLEFETIIGMSAQSQNSNAINGSMTIIEPYGMTLFDNLLAMAATITDAKVTNYLQLPYLLMIDFFGYDNNGVPVQIPGQTKYIPISILEVKMKISTRGAEYNISFAPFSHQAYSETNSTTPAKFEISANNLQEFFLSDPKAPITKKYDDGVISQSHDILDESISAQRTASRQSIDRSNTPQERKTLEDLAAKQEKNSTRYTSFVPIVAKEVKSYTGAFNSWKKASIPSDNAQSSLADIILFEIDDEILANDGGKFPDAKLVNKENKAFGILDPANKDNSISDQNGLHTNVADNRVLMSISAGTPILEVIKLAMTNSKFIRDQIIDLSKETFTSTEIDKWLSKPFRWFKVTPKISLGNFDKVRNKFQQTITYRISAFDTVNYKSIFAPQGQVPSSYVCKDYQYIFTGKNNDIINFDLNFDTQFYILQQVAPEKKDSLANSQIKTASESKKTEQAEVVFTRSEVLDLIDKRSNGINEFRPRTVLTGGTTGTAFNDDSKAEIIKQVAKNVLTTPGGDMISVRLRIIGDPDFIKQDDFFYGSEDVLPQDPHNPDAPTKLQGGSLVTDAHEIFVNLTFKTPTDYGGTVYNNTGVIIPSSTDSQVNNSSIIFSGKYKVLTVKNYFSNGKFEQELELIRQPDQPVTNNVIATQTNSRPNNVPMSQNSASNITTVKTDKTADDSTLLSQTKNIV